MRGGANALQSKCDLRAAPNQRTVKTPPNAYRAHLSIAARRPPETYRQPRSSSISRERPAARRDRKLGEPCAGAGSPRKLLSFPVRRAQGHKAGRITEQNRTEQNTEQIARGASGLMITTTVVGH